jgi:hypothetical protein
MRLRVLALLISLLVVTGLACKRGEKGTMITGQITMDGVPVAQGLITFVPADGKTANASAAIKDGTYKVKAVPGSMRVQISSPKVTGKRKAYDDPNAPMIDNLEEGIPARYNASTTLTAEIQPGANIIDWPLTSK